MSSEMKQGLTVEQFRSVIADKVAALGDGEFELTSHSIQIKSGKYAGLEAEFTTTVGGPGRILIKVDGKRVTNSAARLLGQRRSAKMTLAVLVESFERRKAQAERMAQEQEATTKCNALLQTFPLNDTDPFTWSVAEGRIRIGGNASFPPDRFADFKDLVEWLRMTVKQEAGSNAEVALPQE
jgi:hypothetical protein